MSSVLSYLSKGHERSIRAKKNIVALGILKGITLISNFLLVPLLIDYLDNERFGIWIILNSMASWIVFLDLGISNGLRNKFAEAKAVNDLEKCRVYISTTYCVILLIVLILLALFFLIDPFLNWSSILNTSQSIKDELNLLAIIVFVFLIIKFFFGIISTVLIADQRPSYSSALDTISGLLSLVIVYFLTKVSEGSLIKIGFVMGLSTAIVPIIASVFFYNSRYKNVTPSFKYVDFFLIKRMMNLSLKFFILQIGSIFVYSFSNLIITQLFGPAEVTTYNIAFKYYSIVMIGFAILLTPFWSAYTEAYIKKDTEWIKNSLRKLRKLWLIALAMIIVMTLVSNLFYKVWVGKDIEVPMDLSIFMAVYISIITWSNIYTNFINGTGKIKLQIVSAISVVILLIPLSLLFVKVFGMGVSGVLLAIIVCILPWGIVWPVQVNKILSGETKGIWIK